MTDKNQPEAHSLIYQKKKIAEQDELIDNMIGLDKENRKISKEMDNHMTNQMTQMDKVSRDMDKVGGHMNTTNTRFEKYLDNTSYCKLYLLIFIQGIIFYFKGYFFGEK